MDAKTSEDMKLGVVSSFPVVESPLGFLVGSEVALFRTHENRKYIIRPLLEMRSTLHLYPDVVTGIFLGFRVTYRRGRFGPSRVVAHLITMKTIHLVARLCEERWPDATEEESREIDRLEVEE